ncbi:MAG: isoprenylcysteine carboxylmethyltransferase family protein [Ignavibacterium sp.]|nr:MAG: isoprenylcysteine carboxylmethyltransferase family protein [Ignavibacterium sp.]
MKKILPPQFFYFSITLMILLHFLFPIKTLLNFPVTSIGIVLFVSGAMMAIKEKKRFARVKTNIKTFDKPDKLLTDGLYKYSRNPMYLGFVIALMGVWLLLGSLSPLLMVLIFIFITNTGYISFEEKMMGDTFGELYFAYKNKTRKWI